ncbi:MAG: sel1 repeat family protein [Muribaculaceae bacterium]|nr:sel1 repeat family protein [Muribaculaceae bacterium]
METTSFPKTFVVTNQKAANMWQASGVQLLKDDAVAARRVMLRAALNGNPQAAFALAESYRKSGDARRAFRWYRQAAKQGVVDAMRYVAVAYNQGVGVAADADKAFYWALRVSALTADNEVSTEDATKVLFRNIA